MKPTCEQNTAAIPLQFFFGNPNILIGIYLLLSTKTECYAIAFYQHAVAKAPNEWVCSWAFESPLELPQSSQEHIPLPFSSKV